MTSSAEARENRSTRLKSSAARVVKLSLPHKKIIAFGFFSLAVASGINLFFPYLIGKVLKDETWFRLQEDLAAIAAMLIGFFLIQACFFFLRHYCFTVVGHKIVAELRTSLYKAIMNQKMSFFDKTRSGDLLSRLSSDTQIVQKAITTNISVASRYLIQVIGGTALMFFISTKLALVICLLIPLIVVASIAWGKRLRNLSKKMQAQLGEASVIAEETVNAIHTVKVFLGTAFEIKRYSKAISDSLKTGVSRTITAALFSSSMVFLLHSGIVIALWYGGQLVLQGELSIGDLTAFALYCLIVAVSFGFLANSWDEFMQAVGASERIFEILDSQAPTETLALNGGHPQSRNPVSNISFTDVSFSYPTRPETPVLEDISFEIEQGSCVALVGPSGAGKSTIVSLIAGLYPLTSGSIHLGGKALAEIRPETLRSSMAIVSQDPQIFSVSVRENIRYASPNASTEEVLAAAKAANVDEFASALPEGYDTKVGNKGVLLSAGQRQRIAIARAILRNPQLLILDEATSNLDSENEQAVQQAISRLMQGRTTLIIAHRLSTVQHADKVIVLKDGKICQEGTHENLMQVNGLYQTLVEHQLL